MYKFKKLNRNRRHTKFYLTNILPFTLILLIAASCSLTRFVPENEYLLKSNKIKIDKRVKSVNDKIERFIQQKPNRKILGVLPFHLSFYNMMGLGKERKWKNRLQEVIGEEPVIYDEILTQKSISEINRYLQNRGYYHAVVRDSVSFFKKTARVQYIIQLNTPYRIRSLTYNIPDSMIRKIVELGNQKNPILMPGQPFDMTLVEKEVSQISTLLRERGYYDFLREQVHFYADTNLNKKQVDLTLQIKPSPALRDTSKNLLNEQYRLNDIWVYLDFPARFTEEQIRAEEPDTFQQGNIFIIAKKEGNSLKPSTILSKIIFKPGELYHSGKIDQTYNRLSGLQQFKFIDIRFDEVGKNPNITDSTRQLRATIRLSRLPSQAYQIEFEGTNSDNHWGLGGNLLYKNNNFYGGAELFDLKFSGAFEFLRNSTLESSNGKLSPDIYEYGVEAKILFPEFWIPFNLNLEKFHKRYNPRTSLMFSYNYQKRPYYTRSLLNVAAGYQWQIGQEKSHILNPIEINAITLRDTTPEFSQYFDTLFIRHSYESQFISAGSYTFQYNTQDLRKRKDFTFFRFRGELAGNTLSLINSIMNRQKNSNGNYELFGTLYAQYIRAEADLRRYHYFLGNSNMVYRIFTGIALPYGNNNLIPFIKKFYSGGPNSIRAWKVRSLGPGSFIDNSSYPDLASDIKLEANLEYRFGIYRQLKGAVFIDAGNIWAINRFDDREGALFKWNKFYKEIALGTGFGFRFDFDFILLRLDLGMKLFDPELPENQRWYYSNKSLQFSDVTWNVGIGYPF